MKLAKYSHLAAHLHPGVGWADEDSYETLRPLTPGVAVPSQAALEAVRATVEARHAIPGQIRAGRDALRTAFVALPPETVGLFWTAFADITQMLDAGLYAAAEARLAAVAVPETGPLAEAKAQFQTDLAALTALAGQL